MPARIDRQKGDTMEENIKESAYRSLICEVGKRMYDRGMVASSSGNISIRVDHDFIFCTPTGVSKGFMLPQMISVVDLNGRILEMGTGGGPSSELKLHLAIYKERPDVNAVVHAHPPYATTFAIAGEDLKKPILAESVEQFPKGIPCASYGALSTEEVPQSIAPYIQDYNACLLEFHGAVTWGSSLMTAYNKMESLEYYARLLYQTKDLSIERELPKERVDELLKIKESLGIE